ncbi:TPA: S8 family serine peptidase, partial [Candidatus Woesearchaeota archaeon]|nr:S8 family serine peptidase [Candidatus Woesearchaeota archaeon]
IDTGVDYTHNAFDNCDAQTFQLTGQTTLLNDLVQSEHPYGNNEETTFTIHKPGYTNIAVHFTNLTLEEINGNADTTDRIYILDGNNATIAVYKGEHSSFWTPSVAGDTMHIRLVTDGSVTRDGFVIDQVINGTTNVTMDWSSCSRVAGGWDTYHDDANPLDDHGHGTHVAGIALSQNDTYKGVAPSASVVAVKAISANGKGYASDVLAGIEYCTSNAKRLNISVISMSLACGGNSCV